MTSGSPSHVRLHRFAVRDQIAAVALADALAAAGFAEVGARLAAKPHLVGHGMRWEVDVVDGPYPGDTVGWRQSDAAERLARSIARAHGGFWCGGSTGPAGMASLQRSAPPVLRLSQRTQPPVARPDPVEAPPPGDLSLVPDNQPLRPASLKLLDEVSWSDLSHAYGAAADVPAQITGLLKAPGDWREPFGELVNCLLHQGSCYPATVPALTVLAQMITAGGLTAARRRDVYLTLLGAAGRFRDDIIVDADAAAALGRPPQAGPWAAEVRDAVSSAVPALLTRWNAEPPGNQLALAALAATFPGRGHVLRDHIAWLAATQVGTRAGQYAQLSRLLITGDSAAALASAREIYAWHDDLVEFDIDDELVEAGLRAQRVLSDAVTATVAASASR